ncbi:MAG: hypothetical protein GTN37_01220 [Candidatus Aenigmarchaeota archaeon]|nr:hypothetical protein [Candidatus Aenigmarchaeota archaeon]
MPKEMTSVSIPFTKLNSCILVTPITIRMRDHTPAMIMRYCCMLASRGNSNVNNLEIK